MRWGILSFLPVLLFGEEVLLLKFTGAVGPVSAKYIISGIEVAKRDKAECLIIELDTPGGLDESMRVITKALLSSPIPVVSYVYPSGARAASAGVFIVMASHIAAMTPGTNIGAAHPVALGKEMEKEMKEKVTNDAVAYIKSIAEKRGRNKKWAEDAVRKSISSTEKEALKKGVIDIVSISLDELLEKLEGRRIVLLGDTAKDGGEKILHTKGAEVKYVAMSWVQKFLSILTNPNIAYVFLLLGIYGLFFELQNPGAIFPGVAGGISLILAFYSLHLLPVNYAGLGLILLAIVMFILELKIISHGLLTLGGITSFILGSLILFESPEPYFRLSLTIIIFAAIITIIFFIVIIGFVIRTHRKKPVTGQKGLLGMEGVARTDIAGEGMVMVRSELWQAESGGPKIKKGERVKIIGIEGMILKVKRVKQKRR